MRDEDKEPTQTAAGKPETESAQHCFRVGFRPVAAATRGDLDPSPFATSQAETESMLSMVREDGW